MSKLEDWKKKRRETNIKPMEEAKDRLMSNAEPLNYRLEIVAIPETNSLVIQGDLNGLIRLRDDLDGLIETGITGTHAHFEEGHGLTKANVSVIIQLVDDDEKTDGSHQIS